MDLVLQGEVEGEVLNALAVVDLDPGGVLIGLEMLDDIREPHGEPVEPAHILSVTRTSRKKAAVVKISAAGGMTTGRWTQ